MVGEMLAEEFEPIEEEEFVPRDTLTLEEILTPGVNLAEFLSENVLNAIGQNVIRDVLIDEASRDDWKARNEKALEMAMQVKKAKNFPWVHASNVKYPLLTTAAIQFQARAYPVIVDGSNLVKGRVLGPDVDGTKRDRADRIASHMTWQLLYRMPGWEEETDKLLLMLPIMGSVFRKTYYDAIENANRSEIISGEDFIINYWAKSIETAPRYTQVLRYYPYEVREKIAAGIWLEIPYDEAAENSDGTDDQALGEYYEQHRCIDLDDDGYPEHYVVVCTKEGKVARIAPCFGEGEITVNVGGQIMKLDQVLERLGGVPEDITVVKIERRQYFVKYPFIPAPDGSFYDIGFGELLDSISGVIDTTINQMIDAATLQNAGGGFVGSGINIKSGQFKFAIGEWKRVDTTGGSLRDNVLPLPAAGPAPALFTLLEMLIGAAKEITSVQDVMVGEGTANQPATTTLALIEQGQKVMTGIFKRIHRAFGQELRCLRTLNRDYLDEEEYFQLNDSEDEAVRIGREDYEDRDLDVIPVSDPGQISDMQKVMRAQAMMENFNGDPLINQRQIREDFLTAIGAKDIPRYFEVPPPQPDPMMIADAESKAADAEQKTAGAAEKLTGAAERAFNLGDLEGAAALLDEAIRKGAPNAEQPNGGGGIPGMEGPAPDEGLPGLPEEAAGIPDGGMGEGLPFDPGASGPSGPVGPVDEPQF